MADDKRRIQDAERVRDACIDAALAGYEDASISGLCGEGALEVAISAMRRVDLGAALALDDGSRSLSVIGPVRSQMNANHENRSVLFGPDEPG